MKKNNKFFAMGLTLLLSASVHAASDRFGNERMEVPRSSYTDSEDLNLVISSIPSNGVGSLVLRSVIFSGVDPTTITFYNANLFKASISTAMMLEYTPNFGASSGSGGIPVKVDLDMYISSAIMYRKIGGSAPVLIKYDWLANPSLPDRRN